MVRKVLLLLLFFMVSIFANAQATFDNHSRAIYILDISKYISWPTTDNPFIFRVGILDSDTLLYHAMLKQRDKRDTLHGKKIQVQLFDKEEDITNFIKL